MEYENIIVEYCFWILLWIKCFRNGFNLKVDFEGNNFLFKGICFKYLKEYFRDLENNKFCDLIFE